VGERIRAARKKSGISVRELARRIDASASHVSQVERGLASFSVRALYTAASVLGVSMDSLFEHPEDDEEHPTPLTHSQVQDGSSLDEAGIVQRVGNRPTITLNSGPRWERLTARPESMCEFIEVVYSPLNAGSPPVVDFARHEGREYGIVTRGSLNAQVGFESTVLDEGDSIALDSSVPHRFWNSTADEVRAIWFVLDRYGDPAEANASTAAGSSSHRGATAPHPEAADARFKS
jgi:transcriptional regulator with XRE-family HTH domain